MALAPSEAWQSVERVAFELSIKIKADEYVGAFAAVRQGETGQPQLIDSFPLDRALAHALADPLRALSEVGESRANPVLARAAQQLLKAIEEAQDAEGAVMKRASEETVALLEGQSPRSVALAAESIARDANNAGFFRPSTGYGEFRRMIELLSDAQAPEGSTSASSGSVVLGQPSIRAAVQVNKALEFVRKAMDETRAECERGTGSAGDVSQLRSAVKSRVQELESLVADLGPEGANDRQ